MLKVLGIGGALLFAGFVVFISVIKSSAPNFAFYQPSRQNQNGAFVSGVEYYFPHPGIGPDNKFWPLKAFRDKVWLSATHNPERRADLLLLFADKRLKMGEELLKKNENELAVATVIKAEQYLQEAYDAQRVARDKGADTTGFVMRLAQASLKHREILETMMENAPGDAKPVFSQTLSYPKLIYEKSVQDLNQKGAIVPTPDPAGNPEGATSPQQ